MSAYGSPLLETPHLDSIAARGVRFDRAYCTNPICAPSRASILTGLFSQGHGIMDNVARFDGSQMTFPKVFQSHGYRTALFGKWHLKSDPTGFDHWAVLPGQGHYYNPDFRVMGKQSRVEGHSTELITNMAIDWLATPRPKEPFLLLLQYKAPHRNWLPAPEYQNKFQGETLPVPETLFDDYATRSDAARQQEMSIERDLHPFYDLKRASAESDDGLSRSMNQILKRMTPGQREAWRATYAEENAAFDRQPPVGDDLVRWNYQRYIKDYLRCVAAVDDGVGRVLEVLEASGQLENTLVVYTSDQGFYLGEHGWFDKRFLYEESSRMPLVMSYPRLIPAGEVNTSLIQNIDFGPTLLAAAGLPELPGAHGRSFWKLAQGHTDPAPRDAIYGHYFEYPGVHAVKRHYGIRTQRYKLIHFYYDIDAWELYDLEEDPHELNNLIDHPEYGTVRRELEMRLRELQDRYGDDPEEFRRGLNPEEVEHDARGARVEFLEPPTRDYGAEASQVLTDGRVRSASRHAPRVLRGWLGFRKNDAHFTLDLGEAKRLEQVSIHVLQDRMSWIYLPSTVIASGSTDGVEFVEFGRITPTASSEDGSLEWLATPGPAQPVRFVRIHAKCLEKIPTGQPGAGERAWVFIDEVSVREAP